MRFFIELGDCFPTSIIDQVIIYFSASGRFHASLDLTIHVPLFCPTYIILQSSVDKTLSHVVACDPVFVF